MTGGEIASPRAPWWMRVRGARADVLVAVAVTAVQIAAVLLAGRDQPERASLDVFAVGLLAVGGLVLAVRRRHPVVVLWVVVASTLAYSLTDYPAGGVVLALIVAFFTAQTRGHRVAGFASIALLYVTFVWNGALMGTEPGPSLVEAVAIAAWMLVLVAVAEIVRVRRAYVGEVRERAREAERARGGGGPAPGRGAVADRARAARRAGAQHLADECAGEHRVASAR